MNLKRIHAESLPLKIYFDGGCPVCRREIGFYRNHHALAGSSFVDVNHDDAALPPGVSRRAALERFHVEQADGTILSGAAAFLILWSRLPWLRLLESLSRFQPLVGALELSYKSFLQLRRLWRADGSAPALAVATERWLQREMRSNQAGEFGAVWIYRGILLLTRNDGVRTFARKHLRTEARHLRHMNARVSPAQRSALLPIWRVAGFTTGAVAALLGARAVYRTIEGVERFVDHHYGDQIERLSQEAAYRDSPLLQQLISFRADECAHRDQANSAAPAITGWIGRSWITVIGVGSAVAVWMARRI